MEVIAYSTAALDTLFAGSEADTVHLQAKRHRTFLEAYFRELNSTTMVVEREYVDRDYLRDFAGYYVTCFHEYRRSTTRIHFFSSAFDDAALEALLNGAATTISRAGLQASYLGFIVVKPLPQTVIGRTCLKTYSSDGGRRNFPAIQRYAVNLAGISLTVDSLAFQEQDSVAAACATSALWSAFHATGRLFQHPIPSPTEITKSAWVSIPESDVPNTRTFPSNGLTATQMANAVKAVGLEPQIVGAGNNHIIRSTVYAYLSCQIPVILGVKLFDMSAASPPNNWMYLGGHAVTAAGFSSGIIHSQPYGPTGFLLRASHLDKLYLHDDQLGPFARSSFAALALKDRNGNDVNFDGLITEWPTNQGWHVVAEPFLMLLPLYEKIRIPFSVVHDAILELDVALEQIRNHFFSTEPRIEWDIRLSTVNAFRTELIDVAIPGIDKRSALSHPLPRFLWHVTARSGGTVWGNFVFDATGIEQSNLLSLAIIESPLLGTMLQAAAQAPALGKLQARHTLSSFLPSTSPLRSLILYSYR